MIDPSGWPLEELARSYRAARPFPHLIRDGLLGEAGLARLRQGLAREPHWPVAAGHYQFLTSGEPPSQPELLEFLGALGSARVLRALEAITGQRLSHADGRGYVYLSGHYLLPHSDFREHLGRAVAYAYYAAAEPPLEGGELELFDCALEDGEIVRTLPAARIAPRSDRLALFEVSPASLHQVREVLQGARASIAGWFYA